MEQMISEIGKIKKVRIKLKNEKQEIYNDNITQILKDEAGICIKQENVENSFYAFYPFNVIECVDMILEKDK